MKKLKTSSETYSNIVISISPHKFQKMMFLQFIHTKQKQSEKTFQVKETLKHFKTTQTPNLQNSIQGKRATLMTAASESASKAKTVIIFTLNNNYCKYKTISIFFSKIRISNIKNSDKASLNHQ